MSAGVEHGTVRIEGPGGEALDCLRAEPAGGERASPGGGVVLAPPCPALGDGARVIAERLARGGHVVLAPDLEGRPGDRPAVAALEAAAAALCGDPAVDEERVAAVGCGLGGTLAFLLGCHSRRLAAVVDVSGPVTYAALDPLHPVQPLEMALNLSCPLLAVFGERDPGILPADFEALRERLAAFARPALVEVVPGVALESDDVWTRTLAFLADPHRPFPPA